MNYKFNERWSESQEKNAACDFHIHSVFLSDLQSCPGISNTYETDSAQWCHRQSFSDKVINTCKVYENLQTSLNVYIREEWECKYYASAITSKSGSVWKSLSLPTCLNMWTFYKDVTQTLPHRVKKITPNEQHYLQRFCVGLRLIKQLIGNVFLKDICKDVWLFTSNFNCV